MRVRTSSDEYDELGDSSDAQCIINEESSALSSSELISRPGSTTDVESSIRERVDLLLSNCREDLSVLVKRHVEGTQHPVCIWLDSNLSLNVQENQKSVKELESVVVSLAATLDTFSCIEMPKLTEAEECINETQNALKCVTNQVECIQQKLKQVSLHHVRLVHCTRKRNNLSELLKVTESVETVLSDIRLCMSFVGDDSDNNSAGDTSPLQAARDRILKTLSPTASSVSLREIHFIHQELAKLDLIASQKRTELIRSFAELRTRKEVKSRNLKLLTSGVLSNFNPQQPQPDTLFRTIVEDFIKVVQYEMIVAIRIASDSACNPTDSLRALIDSVPYSEYSSMFLRICGITTSFFTGFKDLVMVLSKETRYMENAMCTYSVVYESTCEIATTFVAFVARLLDYWKYPDTADRLTPTEFAMPVLACNHLVFYFQDIIKIVMKQCQIPADKAKTADQLNTNDLLTALRRRSKKLVIYEFIRMCYTSLGPAITAESWERCTKDNYATASTPWYRQEGESWFLKCENWSVTANHLNSICHSLYKRLTRGGLARPKFDDHWMHTIEAAIRLAASALGPFAESRGTGELDRAGSNNSGSIPKAASRPVLVQSTAVAFSIVETLLGFLMWEVSSVLPLIPIASISLSELLISQLILSLCSPKIVADVLGPTNLTCPPDGCLGGAKFEESHDIFVKQVQLHETRVFFQRVFKPQEQEKILTIGELKERISETVYSNTAKADKSNGKRTLLLFSKGLKMMLNTFRTRSIVSSTSSATAAMSALVSTLVALEAFSVFQKSMTRLFLPTNNASTTGTAYANSSWSQLKDNYKMIIAAHFRNILKMKKELTHFLAVELAKCNFSLLTTWSSSFISALESGSQEATYTEVIWQIDDLHRALSVEHAGSLPEETTSIFWKAFLFELPKEAVSLIAALKVSRNNHHNAQSAAPNSSSGRYSIRNYYSSHSVGNVSRGSIVSGGGFSLWRTNSAAFSEHEVSTIKSLMGGLLSAVENKMSKKLNYKCDRIYINEYMDGHLLKNAELIQWCRTQHWRPPSELFALLEHTDLVTDIRKSLLLELAVWIGEYMKHYAERAIQTEQEVDRQTSTNIN